VIFDYFFPGVIPGSPVSIPSAVMDNWTTVYVPAILGALQANPSATAQFLNVTDFPIGPDPNTTRKTSSDYFGTTSSAPTMPLQNWVASHSITERASTSAPQTTSN